MLRGDNVFVNVQQDLLSDTNTIYEKNKRIRGERVPWKRYEDLYGDSLKGLYKINNEPKKRIIKKINNRIIDKFLTIMLNDIIDNGNEFEFPFNMMTLRIADRDRTSKKYKYNIARRGHDFIPYLKMFRRMFRRSWVYYYVNLRPKWREKLEEAIENGREYKIANTKKQWR